MSLRKWVVRGLVALVLAACLGAGVVYQRWTNPAAVRQQVVEMLQKQFPGATVTLDGARLRLFGGVILTELRVLRRNTNPQQDDPAIASNHADVIHIPQAIVYPNKEKLLEDRAFPVQRIELSRPQIRIVRNREGQWNVDGLVGKTDPNLPLPTIVIEKGVLTIEDKFAGVNSWEIHDLDLTMVNNGAHCLKFAGTGKSETVGAIRVSGNWDRASNATTLSLQSSGLCITKELVHYVANQLNDQQLNELDLEGRADIEANLAYQPGATPALSHDVCCQLRQTCIEHPRLPIPLHNLSALIRSRSADGKVTLEKLKAAAGSGKIVGQGWADLADPKNNLSAQLTVYHLPLTEEFANDLAKRLPDPTKILALYQRFKPAGTANFHFDIEEQKGKTIRAHCIFEPDDLSVCFEKFKYPLERLQGSIDWDFLQFGAKNFEFVGYSDSTPIFVRGNWLGKFPDVDATIEITGQNVPLDEKLLDALPGDKNKGMEGGKIQGLAASFHPTGKANFRGVVRFIPGNMVGGIQECQNTFQIHFLDGTVKWDEFPYPLENVEGDLVIYPRSPNGFDQYQFTNFKGTHNGGEVFVSGGTLPRPDCKIDGKLIVNISGTNVCLDSDLRAAFAKFPRLGETWDTYAPAGRLSFQAQVERLPGLARSAGKGMDMDIGVDVAACTIKPKFFQYTLNDVSGKFRYHKNKIDFTNFTARHGKSLLSITNGTVDLIKDDKGEHDGYYTQLHEFRANPLLVDEEFLEALPKGVRAIADGIKLKNNVVAVDTKIVISKNPGCDKLTGEAMKPEMFWDGVMWVRDAMLAAGIELNHVSGTVASRGLYDGKRLSGLAGNIYLQEAVIFKQPFQGVRAHFFINDNAPDVARFNLDAPFFGGDISGQGLIEFSSSNPGLRSYEVDLTASQVQLDQFGRHNMGANHQLAGFAAGRLHLQGRGSGLEGLEGNGSIDVPYSANTRLLNLGFYVDLLKFLGLKGPDSTTFEEAHAAFAINGNRVTIGKLDLQGNAISVYGKGLVNLDGTDLQLDMFPSWGRAEQLLPSAIRNVPSAISKQLLKIEVRGKLGGQEGDLKFTKKIVPGLMEPFTEMGNRMFGIGTR